MIITHSDVFHKQHMSNILDVLTFTLQVVEYYMEGFPTGDVLLMFDVYKPGFYIKYVFESLTQVNSLPKNSYLQC